MNLEQALDLAKSDETAFKAIYDLTIHRVYSFVLLRVRDKNEALDICQDIYLSFWRSLPNFNYMSDAEFYAFLFKIARRQIIKRWSKVKDIRVELDEIFDIEAPEQEKEDYRVLMKRMEGLSKNERMCLELRYFEDLKFGKIALMLGTTESNAKVLHHRAIKKLKKLLGAYE